MSTASLARLDSGELSGDDIARAQDVVAADPNSPLAVLLQGILSAHARGAAIELVADDAELTPNQAAQILKMSRPHLIGFMDRGDLPFHRVGTHRRIKMSDLNAFIAAREAGSRIVAEALAGARGPHAAGVTLSEEALSDLDEL